MALGAALDPRYKMKLIDCCFPEIYTAFEAAENSSVVLDSLHELYKEYVAVYSLANIEQNSSSKEVGNSGVASYGSKKMGSGRSKFDSFVRKVDSIQPVKSELDIYLEEALIDAPLDSTFQILDLRRTPPLDQSPIAFELHQRTPMCIDHLNDRSAISQRVGPWTSLQQQDLQWHISSIATGIEARYLKIPMP
ncbi:hypothetical protein Vadar_023079 [Vaccinium darrowii]|uniref:Uncharacterized protein n=1 Tax=Vaccinium darrowii TaxID=229202 RepID=A0ACB7XJA6_9ERIC|nr:hypothetical protein Vadar_023079 [Vaccinium darrowii]